METIKNFLEDYKIDYTVEDKGFDRERYYFTYNNFRVAYYINYDYVTQANNEDTGVSNVYYNTLVNISVLLNDYWIECTVDEDLNEINYDLPEPLFRIDQTVYKMSDNRIITTKIKGISVSTSRDYWKHISYKIIWWDSDIKGETLFLTKEDLLKTL